jgi:hypothetical protein
MLLTKDVNHAGTETVPEVESKDYAFKGRTMRSSRSTSARPECWPRPRRANKEVWATPAYMYGTQQVTLPAAAGAVDVESLATALAYLNMPESVKYVANQSAAHPPPGER